MQQIKVTFRVEKSDNHCVAVLHQWATRHGTSLVCVDEQGHSGIDYGYYLVKTRPARPKEYAKLLELMRAAGYDNLAIRRRIRISDIAY
ncbi:MAG: hypothetical protein K5854_01660 [Prevotella sp.]|nr:hypothetical protein [Prevotella sp.]